MTERTSFHRKIAYLTAIVILVFPIYWLSAPATVTREGGRREGGHLAQLRERHNLAQANLGEVDPASETMRFLTLGLRGVAVTVLWEKANHYKKTEDWTNLTATLEQLAKLQPNFITFWKYQAWNLTYNVSVEFDDYHDRYYYVRRGIEFLKEGERYNSDHPALLTELGWFNGHKVGRSDEREQYRRLYKEDVDFHPADRTPDQRDNWLVSKEWYQKAIDAVDIKGKDIGKRSPREFYSDPAKSQINYAEAIEEEGFFEKARRAWMRASDEWRAFGRRIIRHTSGVPLRLGEEPKLQQEVAELRDQLDAIDPDLRELLSVEKLRALAEDERALLETPAGEVKSEDAPRYYEIEEKARVTDRDLAARIARDRPDQAKDIWKLVRQLEEAEAKLRMTRSYKEIVNFDYWQLRSDLEQTQNALDAREFMFRAKKEALGADFNLARQLYEQGFAKWRLVIDEFPDILDDEPVIGDNIIQYTTQYRKVLDQLDEPLDERYPLWDAIERFDTEKVFAEELAAYRQKQQENDAQQPVGDGE